MSLHPHNVQTDFGTNDLLSAIEVLKENTNESINTRRGNERLKLNAPVSAVAGSISYREEAKILGVCHDISPTGGRLIFSKPLHVGDIYLITIEESGSGIDPVFARCVRCHMLREDSYECGILFFTRLNLAGRKANAANDLGI